jgi:AcrR family transcriptional regulator
MVEYQQMVIDQCSIQWRVDVAARKAVDQELSKEKIMEAARELFVTHGYRHVSMRQIAKELGYSHGSIYYHFRNKADLFYSLVNQDFALLDQQLDEVLRQDLEPARKLEKVLLGYIEFGLDNQSHYEIMFVIRDEELASKLQEKPNQSYEKFAQAIYHLSGQKANAALIWSIFLSLHGFVTHYCRSGQSFADVETMARFHVQNLLKWLA